MKTFEVTGANGKKYIMQAKSERSLKRRIGKTGLALGIKVRAK